MRVLYVEDEKALAEITARRLHQGGYSVDWCADGREAEDYVDACDYDLAILDIMLPGQSGIELLRYMRRKKKNMPVLMLTAKDSIADRVEGLDAGADDYLVKPFSFEELSARLRALLRRNSEERNTECAVADLILDTASRSARRGGREIELTTKEYALLEYLMRNKGQVLSRDQIIEHVWNFDFESDSNIVDVYMRYLRRKIDLPFDTKLLHTVRGSGYILKEKA